MVDKMTARMLSRAEIVAFTKKAKSRAISGGVAKPRLYSNHLKRLKELRTKAGSNRAHGVKIQTTGAN